MASPDKPKRPMGRPKGSTKAAIYRRELELQKIAAKEEARLAKAQAALAAAETALKAKMVETKVVEAKAQAKAIAAKRLPGAQPGHEKGENAGRKMGTTNLITSDVKAMILGALSDVGGRRYLSAQAIKNPVAFLALVGRIIPREMTVKTNEATLEVTVQDKDMTREEIIAEMNRRGLPTNILIQEQVAFLATKVSDHDDVPRH